MNVHLFSLTEDTFFLALEDAHKRGKIITGQQKLADSKKVKFFTYKTPEENFRKQKELANKYQARQFIRNGKKEDKSFKKKIYDLPEMKNPNLSDEEKHDAFKYVKNLSKQRKNERIKSGGITAGYNPITRTIGINKNGIKNNYVTKKPMTRLELHKTLCHELEHKDQFDKIKSKYGNTGVRQALARTSANAAAKAVDHGKTEEWFTIHNPIEKNAYKVGAETKSLQDRKFGKDKSFNPKVFINPHLFKKAQKKSKINPINFLKQFNDKIK